MDADTLKAIGILLGLVFSVALHESAHAWTAYRFGDPTAKLLGRVTLNPIPHIDLFGTILLPVILYLVSKGSFTFGYAKPVPVNPLNMRNPVLGSAVTSAAGPLSNFLLSFLLVLAIVLLQNSESLRDTVGMKVLIGVGWMNMVLAVFNLLPIPPLDGSGVVAMFLPPRARDAYLGIASFGFILVIVLLQVPAFSRLLMEIQYTLFGGLLRAVESLIG